MGNGLSSAHKKECNESSGGDEKLTPEQRKIIDEILIASIIMWYVPCVPFLFYLYSNFIIIESRTTQMLDYRYFF